MFAKLTHPPRLPVEAELLPTLFGDTQVRINGQDYAVERIVPGERAVAEALKLTHGDTGYLLVVTRAGEAHCSCPSFEFECRRDSRCCKHLFSCYLTGLLTHHRPEFITPTENALVSPHAS